MDQHAANRWRHRDLLDARLVDPDRQYETAEQRRRNVVDVNRITRDRLARQREPEQVQFRQRLVEQRIGRDDRRNRGGRRTAEARAKWNALIDGNFNAERKGQGVRHGDERRAGAIAVRLQRQVGRMTGDGRDADARFRQCGGR